MLLEKSIIPGYFDIIRNLKNFHAAIAIGTIRKFRIIRYPNYDNRRKALRERFLKGLFAFDTTVTGQAPYRDGRK